MRIIDIRIAAVETIDIIVSSKWFSVYGVCLIVTNTTVDNIQYTKYIPAITTTTKTVNIGRKKKRFVIAILPQFLFPRADLTFMIKAIMPHSHAYFAWHLKKRLRKIYHHRNSTDTQFNLLFNYLLDFFLYTYSLRSLCIFICVCVYVSYDTFYTIAKCRNGLVTGIF